MELQLSLEASTNEDPSGRRLLGRPGRGPQEREYWRCQMVDLIAAERERLVVLIEEERRNLID
jgi:hypothetical protein